jgi:hypothetical protein
VPFFRSCPSFIFISFVRKHSDAKRHFFSDSSSLINTSLGSTGGSRVGMGMIRCLSLAVGYFMLARRFGASVLSLRITCCHLLP